MSRKFPLINSRLHLSCLPLIISILITGGCAVGAARSGGGKTGEKTSVVLGKTETGATGNAAPPKNKITIAPDSPADTVRVFYDNLRAGKFRDALFLTNLRPAIEGLTDAELKDLQVDFANLARQIPAEININGEIISGDDATVTAKLPDNETDNLQLQQIRLRREKDVWTILTVDEPAEKIIRREGRKYFLNLKIETHQREAKDMLNRIAKAQMIYAAQNNGLYGDAAVLVEKGFLPADVQTADSTGYDYKISLFSGGKEYAAIAEPSIYGKTGKLTFSFKVEGNRTSALKSTDAKGLSSDKR